MGLGAQSAAGWGTREGFRFPGRKIGCLRILGWVRGRPGVAEQKGWPGDEGVLGARRVLGTERAVIPRLWGHRIVRRWLPG